MNTYIGTTVEITRLIKIAEPNLTGQSKCNRTARSATAFTKSSESSKQRGTKGYIH